MNIALVTDGFDDFVETQIKALSREYTVCVFLPASYDTVITIDTQVRKFEEDFNEAMFQRYDNVLFYSISDWDAVLPVMMEVKGVAIIDTDSEYYEKVAQLTAFQFHPGGNIVAQVSSLFKHIHWFDREVNLIYNRLESFGLLTDRIKKNFEDFYGIPLSKDWLSKVVKK